MVHTPLTLKGPPPLTENVTPSEMDYLKQLTLLTWSSKGMVGVRKGEGSQPPRAQGGARLPLGLVLGGPSRPDC